MMKFTFRIWMLIIFLVLSLLSIFSFPPSFLEKGVIIDSIEPNSPAFNEGLRNNYVLTSVNENKISNSEDYGNIISSLFESNTEQIKLIFNTNQGTFIFFTDKIPEISVKDIPMTKIKTGLDLQGGSRALVKPEEKQLTSIELDDLIAVTNERLNVYGLTDISIRAVTDLSGDKFMLIEIAGASPKELGELISEQGKFEAKIGDEVVFVGGENDITYVCRNDAACSRIEACFTNENTDFCNYAFTITLSEKAAKRHAEITNTLGKNSSKPEFLDKTLDFYVDGKLTESLFISENLKGRETTQISIQGSGSGPDRNVAIEDSQNSMKKMQTILITGSLPYKLEIVKLDRISPLLGQKFNSLIWLTGLVALSAVAIVIFIRYRTFKSSLALLLTSFSEIVIILGIASLIKWNLDLPSIAGILIIIGTGVDQQIIILDESKSKIDESIKQKIKNALFIVVSAYFTTLVSLVPVYWAGAGLLKGFAVTTLIGLTVGVLITRPAFADMVKAINDKNAS